MTSEIVAPLVTSFLNLNSSSIYFWDEVEKAWYFTYYGEGSEGNAERSNNLRELGKLHARLNELSANASEDELRVMLTEAGIRNSHAKTLAVAAWKFKAEIKGLPERARLEERIKRLLPRDVSIPFIMKLIDNYSQHQKPSDDACAGPLKEPEAQVSTPISLPSSASQLDLF